MGVATSYINTVGGGLLTPPPGDSGKSQLVSKTRASTPPLLPVTSACASDRCLGADILAPSPGDLGHSHLVSKCLASTASLLPVPTVTHARASDRRGFNDFMLGVFAGVTGHPHPNFRGAQLPVHQSKLT